MLSSVGGELIQNHEPPADGRLTAFGHSPIKRKLAL
jgi:hypothetical protein